MSKRAATSFFVRAVVGSSMMMSFASPIRARLMATSCLSATDRLPTSSSRSTSKPIFATASRATSRIRERFTRRRPAATSLPSAMFSITERFGKIEKSW